MVVYRMELFENLRWVYEMDGNLDNEYVNYMIKI